MTYPEAVEWLYGQQWHGIRLGLANMRRLAKALHLQTSGPRAPHFLHVAGTNGKGSVCAFLDSILRAAGHRTGLFTSPHLVSFRERIRVQGEFISEDEAAAGLTRLRRAIEGWDPSPTFFELTTALALEHFARQGVEIAVLETGLGGRLDATNIVTPAVSILTPIDFDHQQHLGDTLAQIAFEKAGIIKPGVPVVSAWQQGEARTVIMQIAAHRGSPLHLVSTPLEGVALGLHGQHQRWNAAVAVHALDVAGIELPEGATSAGLQDVHWPGRFQTLALPESAGPDGVPLPLVLDGAHNPSAARRLAETWRETYGEQKATVIFGAVKDKDLPGLCAHLVPLAAEILAVPIPSTDRALAPETVVDAFHIAAPWLSVTVAPSLARALASAIAGQRPVLVTGSLFLIGEAVRLLQGGGDGFPTAQ